MVIILGIVAALAGLASLIFFIMVLIKLFKAKGALHGILGIFCGIYTFIWGWINADAQGIRKIMVNWTIAVVVQIVFQIAAGAMAASHPPAAIEP